MPYIILPHHYEDGAHRDFAVGDGVVAGRVPKNTAVREGSTSNACAPNALGEQAPLSFPTPLPQENTCLFFHVACKK
jgi:hypothetical protein